MTQLTEQLGLSGETVPGCSEKFHWGLGPSGRLPGGGALPVGSLEWGLNVGGVQEEPGEKSGDCYHPLISTYEF